ncbi:MAG: helix-turn-helix transcriptional regulator [Butyrivibrio sp.]|nr:helix-turn-helix transcriptional regulator [Butyrivibrio sp.]
MDISNTSIGGRVRTVREERGYTREQLAEYADISSDFLWQVETGRSSLSVQNLGKIAAALDVTTDYLIYGKTAYTENVKINTMIAALPVEIQRYVEKSITVFVDALRESTKALAENDNSEKE